MALLPTASDGSIRIFANGDRAGAAKNSLGLILFLCASFAPELAWFHYLEKDITIRTFLLIFSVLVILWFIAGGLLLTKKLFEFNPQNHTLKTSWRFVVPLLHREYSLDQFS